MFKNKLIRSLEERICSLEKSLEYERNLNSDLLKRLTALADFKVSQKIDRPEYSPDSKEYINPYGYYGDGDRPEDFVEVDTFGNKVLVNRPIVSS